MTDTAISTPAWVPETVKAIIGEIKRSELSADQRMILKRLASDPRMKNVWGELQRRKRTSDRFVYPALRRKDVQGPLNDHAQLLALGELFLFVFTATRDQMRTIKLEEIQHNKEYQLENAKLLRGLASDLELARSRGMFGVDDPFSQMLADRDVLALRHVAGWLEHLTEASRRPGDALIVKT